MKRPNFEQDKSTSLSVATRETCCFHCRLATALATPPALYVVEQIDFQMAARRLGDVLAGCAFKDSDQAIQPGRGADSAIGRTSRWRKSQSVKQNWSTWVSSQPRTCLTPLPTHPSSLSVFHPYTVNIPPQAEFFLLPLRLTGCQRPSRGRQRRVSYLPPLYFTIEIKINAIFLDSREPSGEPHFPDRSAWARRNKI